MGYLWDYFFQTVNVKAKKVDAEETKLTGPKASPASAGMTCSSDSNRPKNPQCKRPGPSSAEGTQSPTTTSEHQSSTSQPPSSSGPGSSGTAGKDDGQYNECGEVRTKRLDGDLPNNIDQSQLTPVESHFPECFDLKVEYDKCFIRWFATDYLLQGSQDLSPCEELMEKYSSCVQKGLKEHNLVLFPSRCLYTSADPNIKKVDQPRKKPPPGATVVNNNN